MEHRLHQAGDLHRIGEMDIFREFLQQGDDIRMGPLVRTSGGHADHGGFRLEQPQQLPGGGGQGGMVGHLQDVAGGGGLRLPHVGVGVAPQNDLLPMVVQPLAQAGDVHGLSPVNQVIAVPLPPEGGVVHRSLPGVQGGLAEQDVHGEVVRQPETLHPVPRQLLDPADPVSVPPQGAGVQVHTPQHVPRCLGQAVVSVRVQRAGIGGGRIGGQQLAHSDGLQHPAQTTDVVPVEVGDQQDIQMRHTLTSQEIPGKDPAGAGVLHRRVVVPLQAVVAAVHQHGKTQSFPLHLPDQDGVAVAHVDEVQYQHVQPPCSIVAITISQGAAPGNRNRKRLPPNFCLKF